jgi:hypothetical protein
MHRVMMRNVQLEGDAAGRRGGDAQLRTRPLVSQLISVFNVRKRSHYQEAYSDAYVRLSGQGAVCQSYLGSRPDLARKDSHTCGVGQLRRSYVFSKAVYGSDEFEGRH